MSKRVPDGEKDVARYLARGMVLHERRAGVRSSGSIQYVLMRPVIEDGVIVRLVEDEETDEANAAPGRRYAVRAKDVDRTMLEEIAPGVRWLSNRAMEKMRRLGESVLDDPRRRLAPIAGIVRPEAFDRAAGPRPVRSDQLDQLGQRDGARDALRALLEGQHLVRREIGIPGASGGSNRSYWRPMLPHGDQAAPNAYEQTLVSMRYAEWAGRPYGFSQDTIDSISTLLERVDFDAEDPRAGPAYCLSPHEDRGDLARLVEWVAIGDHHDILHAALPAPRQAPGIYIESNASERALVPLGLRRKECIIALLERRSIDVPATLGDAPAMEEIASALVAEILTTRDEERGSQLVAAALRRALSARTSAGFWDCVWSSGKR